jgi:hypothetical protein
MRRHARQGKASVAGSLAPLQLDKADVSLLDVIDHVLNQGVVISGEITIGVADVDLIYLQLQALVCSADRAQSSGAAFRPFITDLGEV